MKDYLDIREINGYSIQQTAFVPADSSQPAFECIVYIGLPNNPQYMGVQEPQTLAEHIFQSKGPSGENKEYLFMLENALNELGHDSQDKHVQDIADRIRKLEPQAGFESATIAIQDEVQRVKSGHGHGEQEELEHA